MKMGAVRVVLLFLLQTAAALKLLVPGTHRAWLWKNVQIPCSFTVDKPPVDRSLLVIIWYFQGKEVFRVNDKSETKTNVRLSYGDKIWDGGADLYISNTSLSDGGLYKCSVIYGSQKKEGDIRVDILAPPLVTITGKTVVLNRESILRCSITGFYPVDIDIRWFRGTEMLTNVIAENPWRNQDGVYNVNGSVTIIPTEEDREQNFSCRVQHESLQQPLQKIFQLSYGAEPSIHILPHTFKKNVEQILVCYVSGFYPESIVVNWLLNGTSVEKTEIKRINSSALEAVLHLMPTEENWGMEVSCAVEHETLPHPQTKSLTILGKDLKAKHKTLVVLAAVLLSVVLGSGTISYYIYRYKQKRHPKLRAITRSTDGSFSLNIDHFYPKEISVTWEVFQPPSHKPPQELQSINLMQENQDGTFNVTSTTESLRDKVNEREEYKLRAVVSHQKLKHPSYREWTNQNKDNTSFMSSPELGEIVTPNLILNSQTQIQCTISRFYPDHLTVIWIKKVMGNEEIMTSEKIIPHRSQQQRDKTFTSTACLVFTPSMEDQGSEIICRVTHPSLEQPAERSTGQLQVWVKPTIDHPIQLSISDSGDVMATLSLLRLYPKDIMITWSYGQSLEKTSSKETVTDNPDGTFSINTMCTIPGNLFEEKDFKINVTWRHETMDKDESRDMFIGHPDFPWRPRIVDMTPLILQMGKQTTVTCKISAFFPNNLTVTWYEKNGTSIIQCTGGRYNISCTGQKAADNSYSCSASLSFTAQSPSDDLEFICKVLHPSLENPIERSTGKAMMRVIPQMVEPVKLTLSDPDRVKCSMRLTKFFPSDVQITWTSKADNDKPIHSTRKLIQTDDEQTFDAESECTIPWRYFMPGVRVTWEHQSLTSPQHRDLHIKDFPWRPVMEEIDKPDFLVDTEVTLQCKISHYFPSVLTVSWFMKRNGNLDQMENTTLSAERQCDNTHSCTAILKVTPSVREHDGAEIICRLQHPSLEQYIEKSTGPIQVYAFPRMPDPIQWSLSQDGEVLCTLRLQSFYPKSIEIEWSCSSNSSVTSRETYEDNPDSTCNVTSQCTVTQENITDPDFRVTVTWRHKSLDEPEKREIYIRDAGLPWRPTVSEIFTPILSLNEVQVHCDISGYFPRTLTVTWLVKERGSNEYISVDKHRNRYQIKSMNNQKDSDTGYHSTAALQFRPVLTHHHGIWLMCRVQHPSLELPIQKTTGPLYISLTPELREEKIITVCDKDEVLCSVNLRRFFPKKINITWKHGESDVMATKTILQVNDDEEEAFDAISECRIPCERLRFPVQVTWKHESMAEQQCLQLQRADFPWHPVMEEIDKPDFLVDTEATLQCKISHYFPNDLTVSWYMKRNGNLVKMENTTLSAERQGDNTHSCTAILKVTPSVREHDGAEIICRVQRPSLEQYIEKSTGPIQVYAFPRMPDPIQWSLSQDGEVLCTLTLQRFYPKSIDIEWSCSSNGSVKSIENYENNPDSTCNVTSQCTVTQENITDPDFRVTVTWRHKSLDKPGKEKTYIKNAGLPWCPTVSEIFTPILSLNEVHVHCDISGYFPRTLTVTWLVKERGSNEYTSVDQHRNRYQIKSMENQKDSDTGYHSTAELQFRPVLTHHHGIWLMCRVQHPSLELPIERTTGPLYIPLTPELKEEKIITVCDKDEVLCSVNLRRFFPKKINITWKNGESDVMASKTILQVNDDEEEAFDAISECRIPWKKLRFPVQVTWKHESMAEQQCLQLQRAVMEEIDKPDFLVDTEATLQCKISHYFPSDLTVSWYMKRNGNLVQMENTTPSAERQRDNTHSCTAILKVTPSVREHDGAEIICRVQRPSLEQYIEKSTGPIQVYASPRMPNPIQWSLSQDGEVLCTLRLQRFYPKSIDIEWSCSSNGSVKSRETYEDNSDSTCNVTSQCTVTQENITDPDFRVTVTWRHKSLLKPGKEKMYIKNAGLPWRPTVSEIFTPILSLNNEVQVHCDISGYFPRTLTVTWLVKERGSNEYISVDQHRNRYQIKSMENQKDSDTGYHSTAELQFRPVLTHHHGIWLMCRVQHPSLELPIERTTGPLYIPLTPELGEEKLITVCDKDEVLCSVNLRRFFPKKIYITWKNGESDVMASKTILQVNDDEEEAFDAISECRIPSKKLRFPVQVTWKHESMAEQQCLQLQRAGKSSSSPSLGEIPDCKDDIPWRPFIQEIDTSNLIVNNPESVLHCRISGYSPDAVKVLWYKKEKGALESTPLHDNDKYKISVTESQRQPDSTYSCTASLSFTPTLRDQESEIICTVEHASLETPLEKSSGPLKILLMTYNQHVHQKKFMSL